MIWSRSHTFVNNDRLLEFANTHSIRFSDRWTDRRDQCSNKRDQKVWTHNNTEKNHHRKTRANILRFARWLHCARNQYWGDYEWETVFNLVHGHSDLLLLFLLSKPDLSRGEFLNTLQRNPAIIQARGSVAVPMVRVCHKTRWRRKNEHIRSLSRETLYLLVVWIFFKQRIDVPWYSVGHTVL